MAKPLAEMSERELRSEKEKSDSATSKSTDELIQAGRGQEKPSETRIKDDPISKRWQTAMDRHNEIVDEERKRERYHGSLKPIKKHRF